MKLALPRGFVISLLWIAAAASGFAQVPQLLNYQGRVAVGSTPFTGTGQFKFALVSTTGATTYWSNDGSSTAGAQPSAAVPLTVTNGLYSLLLGDTAITNMVAIPNAVFGNSDVRLRVWFNDGTNGFQLLTPDQRLGAVGYAIMAASVPDASISSAKLAAGAAAANLAASGQTGVPSSSVVFSGSASDPNLTSTGYVRLGQMTSSGAWEQRIASSPPTARFNCAAVWTGTEMIVWGGDSAIGPTNTGGRYNPTTNVWTPLTTTNAPGGRHVATAVWTGSAMIIYGGNYSTNVFPTPNGSSYNPMTDAWTALPTTNDPGARLYHTAVWSGSEMIIWGGFDSNSNPLASGARYNPATQTWSALAFSPLAGRGSHSAIWSGTEMIIWGGTSGPVLGSGARYNPSTDAWVLMGFTNVPSSRCYHTAVWSGSEMIIWGGSNGSNLNTGGRYNPTTDAWTALPVVSVPAARSNHTAVWTGTSMIIWGGGSSGAYYDDGAVYTPATDTWAPMNLTILPPARAFHCVVWTGSSMLLFGGYNPSSFTTYNDTWSYSPPRTLYLYQRP